MTRYVSVVAIVLAGACSSDPAEVVDSPVSDAGLDASGGRPSDASMPMTDAGPQDASTDGEPVDAGVAPVLLGVVPIPTPAGADGGGEPADNPAEVTIANLEVLSAGSRAVSEQARWDALFDTAEQPNDSRWLGLREQAALYQDLGRSLLLCVSLVDRAIDARPADLSGLAWNDAATRVAAERVIDEAFETYEQELAFLTLGNEVDRYLASVEPADRDGLTELLRHLLDYAREHPDRPPETRVGVTFTLQSLREDASVQQQLLLDNSDVAVATYFPADADFQARPASVVTQDLDAPDPALESRWSAIAPGRTAGCGLPELGAGGRQRRQPAHVLREPVPSFAYAARAISVREHSRPERQQPVDLFAGCGRARGARYRCGRRGARISLQSGTAQR